MATVSVDGPYAKLWTILFIGVQALIAVAGFFMAHTLSRVEGTLTTINAQLFNHEGRIAKIEGRTEKDWE